MAKKPLFGQAAAGPVECLGLKFQSDDARREHFLGILRDKLKDPAFRKIEGFPIGKDEDILALSDPPYYTACPNPFVEDFIKHYGTPYDPAKDNYHREPFATDVSEGRTDPIYMAHSYHTKVPHQAIMRYILHYTEPGDVVFDGFAGTGMTGVAAQLCGSRDVVESLGYKVKQNGALCEEDVPISKLGERYSILNDLSPAASFIAYNYNVPADLDSFEAAARELLSQFEATYGWMYQTTHRRDKTGRINYVVWSDVFLCNHCQGEVVFWTAAVENGEVQDEGTCPHCRASVSKNSLERVTTSVVVPGVKEPIKKARRVPVLINYTFNGDKFEKKPDQEDLALLRRIEREPVPGWYPTRRIDEDIDLWYERDYRSLGIYTIDAFFEKRAIIMVCFFHEKIMESEGRMRGFLWFWFESVLMGFSLLNRFLKNAFSQVNRILSGTLYVGAMHSEVSPWYSLEGKIKRLRAFERLGHADAVVGTASTAVWSLPENSVDYIFTDPPFGSNIIYSDLSILWEAWLNIFTNTAQESVVHRRKKHNAFTLVKYTQLMTACFTVMHHVLKPGRWMTVEFHNTRNSVWNAIQEALLRAGFVVADVRTLDKQMGTFKQVTATGAVKQDLVISGYKPATRLEEQFKLKGGTVGGAWEFVSNHLRQLPVFVSKGGQGVDIAERHDYLLFDRMVAFHVQRGVSIPMSAAEFYAGLQERFPPRDGMYFLPEQAAEYDKKRMTVSEVQQLELFVLDEASAIQWLRQQLAARPRTFQELQPQFMQELAGWQKHEQALELSVLLEQNFVCYSGEGPVSSQIHAYLSSNFKELRNLDDDDPRLVAKARSRWYVPNPGKEVDLEQIRHRALLKEFRQYQAGKGKLKVVRKEVLRAGFTECWQSGDYGTIIQLARRLPDEVIQEDPALLMYYDNALVRTEG